MIKTDKLLELIDAAYEAALDESMWPRLLHDACDAFATQALRLFTVDVVNHRITFAVDHGITDEALDEYEEHILAHDERIKFVVENPDLVYSYDYLHTSESEMRRSKYYDWLQRAGGFRYYFGSRVRHSDHTESYVSFQRLQREGHVDSETFDAFTKLAPHLQRAVQISRRLANRDLRVQASEETLDRLPFGVLLLDRAGRVLTVNAATDAILGKGDGLRLDDGRLRATARATDVALQRLVDRTIATSLGVGLSTGGSLAVPRSSGCRPYFLLVTPFGGRDRLFATRQPAVAVFLTDPEQKLNLQAEILRQSHGLTPTETRLAALLASGYPVDQAAEQLGCARSTARLHLEHIYAKTGVHRQVDLVRLLLTSPVILRPGNGANE